MCGAIVPPGQAFCGKCGAKQIYPAPSLPADADACRSTILTNFASPGDTQLNVASLAGFQPGMAICIGVGVKHEVNEVAGYGSTLILRQPLQYDHASGTVVKALPAAQASTYMTTRAMPGDTELQVASQAGFQPGQAVSIGEGFRLEVNELAGFGSLVLRHPLRYDHHPGTMVKSLPVSSTISTAPAEKDGMEMIVASVSGFKLGQAVSVGEGNMHEVNEIYEMEGKGVRLRQKLLHNHPSGTVINALQAFPGLTAQVVQESSKLQPLAVRVRERKHKTYRNVKLMKEKRLAKDGYPYVYEDFIRFYGDNVGQEQWIKALPQAHLDGTWPTFSEVKACICEKFKRVPDQPAPALIKLVRIADRLEVIDDQDSLLLAEGDELEATFDPPLLPPADEIEDADRCPP
jgi:hypothetical protein